MAKTSMPCPTPGCDRELPVKKSSKGKPTVFCDVCGFQGFVRYPESAKRWFNEDDSALGSSGRTGTSVESRHAPGTKGILDF